MGKLANKLQEAVRKLSYKTTVDQLKRRGIQKVNVVGLDRIVALIEAAVHRTLKARMAGFEGYQMRGEIADATREEFLKLLQSHESLEKAHEEISEAKDALEGEVGRLRDELRAVQSALAEREERMAREAKVRAAEDDAELHQEVQSLLAKSSLGGDLAARGVVEEVLRVVQLRLTTERQRVAEVRRRESQSEIDLLNRRLAKLSSSLQQTEAELSRVVSARTEEPGIASVFREVQGVSDRDAHYQQKRELMTSIFEANRKLQGLG